MRINMKQPVLDYEGSPIVIDKTNPDGYIALDARARIEEDNCPGHMEAR